MRWKFRPQRLDHPARRHHFAHRNGVHPNRAFLSASQNPRGNSSKPLAQPRPVLPVPQHLQQPVGERDHQQQREQRTVKHIHQRPILTVARNLLTAPHPPNASYNHVCTNSFAAGASAPTILPSFLLLFSSAAWQRSRRKNSSCPKLIPRAPTQPMTSTPWKK